MISKIKFEKVTSVFIGTFNLKLLPVILSIALISAIFSAKTKELKVHEKDTGSSEVQIGLLTEKISNLSEHIKKNKKDKHSSVGLLKAVNKRKKLLENLKKIKIDI